MREEAELGGRLQGCFLAKLLSLPPAFLNHFSWEKCKKAILKSSLGKSWQVKVCGGKKGLWFGDGWFDFVRDHDLQLGECLLFCFDGCMVFHITIFDTSGCEKKLPLGNENDEMLRKQESKEVLKFPSAMDVVKDTSSALEGGKLTPLVRQKEDHGEQRGTVCGRSDMIEVEAQSSYQGKNPHFVITIQRCNIGGSYLLIPADFRKAKNVKQIGKMTLVDPHGRSWPVNIVHRHRGGIYSAHFSGGWIMFQRNNALKVGDRCIFELTDTRKRTMHVHITRMHS